MKKILLGIIAIFCFAPLTSAVNIVSFQMIVDKQLSQRSSDYQREQYIKGILGVITGPKMQKELELRPILDALQEYLEQQLKETGSSSPSQKPSSGPEQETTDQNPSEEQGEPAIMPGKEEFCENKSEETSHFSIPNVNLEKVRKQVLERHNGERSSCGLGSYAYHSDLEKSASYRSNYLSTNGVTSQFHKRPSWSGTYNYNGILSDLEGMGIYFPALGGGKNAFSESVGYGSYTCNSSDCTDVLINAIKKTRNFFMSEKSYKGSHYRAITMPQYTQMGIGISINAQKKYYYMVVHYGVHPIEACK